MKRSSKNRLTTHQLDRFSADTLFDRIARSVCHAECLPRKELYEAWEVARRVRRKFRGGRVVDLACGHGLLAQLMLLLDDSSPNAIAVDINIPPSAVTLTAELSKTWPRLESRISFIASDLNDIELHPDDLIVSAHACGQLTDLIIDRAIEVRATVAVLPCCHDLKNCNTGNLEGWLDGPLSIDVTRAAKLRAAGYRVTTQTIPEDITPKNRLLLAEPI